MRILFLTLICGIALGYPVSWLTQLPVQPTGMPPIRIAGSNLTTSTYRTWDWRGDQKIAIDGFTNSVYSNLVAWYDFFATNEVGANSGSNAVDYSVSNSPATVFIGTSSGATWVASSGPTSSYYSFDGTSQYLLISNSAYLLYTNSWSLCVWTYCTISQTWSTISARYGSVGSPRSNLIRFFNMSPELYLFDSGGAGSSGNLVARNLLLSKWNHVVYIYNNQGNEKIYVNGNPDISTNLYDNYNYNTQPIRIGMSAITTTTQFWPGFLDDVRIYNSELSATEVTNIFNATKGAHPNPAW